MENVSLLYKFLIPRHAGQRIFRQNAARGFGYRFNWTGNLRQQTAMALAPSKIANPVVDVHVMNALMFTL